jgi:dolichol-phosphate mannosyltransferase
MHRFLRGMVHWLGFSTATVRFQVASRGAGHSKFTFRRLFAFAIDALLSFSKAPLRLAFALGVVVTLLGFLHSVYACIAALVGHGLGWEILLSLNLMMGGSILIVLGVLGEYIGRIYEQVKGRPLYLLKEQWPERVPRMGALDAREQRPPGNAAA